MEILRPSLLSKKSAIFIASFSFFLLLILTILFLNGNFTSLDSIVNKNIPELWSPSLNFFFEKFSDIGDIFVLGTVSFLLFLFLVYKKRFSEGFFLASSMIFGTLFFSIMKWFLKIPRPVGGLIEESSYSFPSGHATTTTVFFLVLVYLFSNRIKSKTTRFLFQTLSFLVIALIGFSRIYLGVHRVSEVLAGLLIGIFCVSISTILCHTFCNGNFGGTSYKM